MDTEELGPHDPDWPYRGGLTMPAANPPFRRIAASPEPPPERYLLIPEVDGEWRIDLAETVTVDEPDGTATLIDGEDSPSIPLGPLVDMEGGQTPP